MKPEPAIGQVWRCHGSMHPHVNTALYLITGWANAKLTAVSLVLWKIELPEKPGTKWVETVDKYYIGSFTTEVWEYYGGSNIQEIAL